MTRLLSSRGARWALPGVVAAAVAAAAITTTGGAGASERPNLPARTAAQLLAAVEQAHPQSLSGTIVETAHLGLPSLPMQDSGGGGVSLQTLLAGSHTVRIWYDGPERQRLALLAPLAERDVIHNGNDLWTYTSTTNQVTHTTVGRSGTAAGSEPPAGSEPLALTPQQAAEQALRAIDPSTKVTVDLTARVAGRAAYQLDLVPRDTRSLVSSVRIAIDAQTSVPLRVQIFGTGTSPSIEVGFTDISFGAPSPSVFHFVPPSGATVTQGLLSGSSPGEHAGQRPTGDAGQPQLLGSGWTAVVRYPLGSGAGGLNSDLLDRASIKVPAGELIKTSLLSVLVTHNGDVLVGPVSGADIQRVAATGHGL
jgi:outer membrane lipoprotein-sorting protein